jgi:hypothetical protein
MYGSRVVDAALLAILPPHLLICGALPKVHAGLAIRTAIELGILPAFMRAARAEDVDAEIRELVAEDLDRELVMRGSVRSFEDLSRPEQTLFVRERLDASPIRHLYEYLRTAAMIGHLAAPVGAEDLVEIGNAA